MLAVLQHPHIVENQAILGRAQEGGVWLRDGARLLRLIRPLRW